MCSLFRVSCPSSDEPRENKIVCGTVEDANNIKQCFMDYSSSVDRDDFVIPGLKDESIKAVYMKNNSNIEFLPVQIYRKFPNLLRYSMINCGFSEIFKKNFENLNQLQILDLSDNRIEIVRSDTFEGLFRLENIVLSKSKFKILSTEIILFENRWKQNQIDEQSSVPKPTSFDSNRFAGKQLH